MSNPSRFVLPLLAGAALSVLAACGPGAEPPAAPAPGETADPATEDTALAEVQAADEAGGEDHAHDEDEGHDHDEDETHDDDHDGDHDHDHDDDHAGGSAHVHGIADLAFALEGSTLTAEMISPLANFGLSEAEAVFSPEVVAALPGLITVSGGDCASQAPVGEIDTSSGHTDARVTFTWTCASPGGAMTARFAGFDAFPGFETINAVFIGETVQKAAELTPSTPELSLK